jgi:hypothetical protein
MKQKIGGYTLLCAEVGTLAKRRFWALVVVLGVGLLSGGGCSRAAKEAGDDGREVMIERVRAVDKLTLAQMRVSKMAVIDDVKPDSARGAKQMVAAIVDAVKIGDRKAAYSYDTYMQAYVDLAQVGVDDIDVDEETGRVALRLPQPQVEFAGRDAGIREDHYRVTGLRSQIGPEERAALKEKMNSQLKAEVRDNGEFEATLLREARERGESYFRELLGGMGYGDVTVSWR